MPRLALLLIFVLASTAHAQTSKLIKLGAPAPASVEGYDKGHCIAVKNIRICKLLSDDKDTFLVQKDGKNLGTWSGIAFLAETSKFEVLTGDLDNDGKPELIVANNDGMSNGLGVDYWTIFIFPDPQFHTFNAPLRFSVEEYSSFGTFVTSAGRVNILTTSWVNNKDPKGRRGWGTYLVGQWWRYQSGELRPMLERPIIARRYLFGFENERNAAVKTDPIPFKWLSNPRTESVGTEFITKKGTTSKSGVIQSVRREKESITVVFKPRGEQATTYIYPGKIGDKDKLDYVGNTASGRLYPTGYLPSQADKWLKNKRATLQSYGDNNLNVLWLERP